MAIPPDFRTLPFETARVADSGRYVGRSTYWKLYVVENLIRVVVHSVLSIQVGPAWWNVAVDSNTNGNVQKVMRNYASQPSRSLPGRHKIYYLYLPDLMKIISTNSHLFRPIIPDIDSWIVRFEQIRLPRNIVGHMNWLNSSDKTLIDEIYTDLKILMRKLLNSGVALDIP